MESRFTASAYGGPGWSPRSDSLHHELGTVWGDCGVDTEWRPLKSVLLHRPGAELQASADPDQAQMLAPLDLSRAQAQHDAMAQAYRDAGVTVHQVEPNETPPPNLIFAADLLFTTPEGVILGRPASTVRAGEERLVARRLAELGIPILRSVRGRGTFEGADAAWIDPSTVMLATGLRTNAEGAAQVTSLLIEMEVEVIPVGLPFGAMHLMGTLRIVDRDLAFAWPGRVPYVTVEALRSYGFSVHLMPDEREVISGSALNFVTLGPRSVLMAAGNPRSARLMQSAGVRCQTVEVDELIKAAGGIGCLSGILQREIE